jgi:signal transduction histidine kinase
VYFCCLEAVQNAVKHSAADALVLRLTDDAGELQFEVTDRGAGFVVPAALRPGSGLAGMEDRLRAVGGRLDVTSAPGAGTTIAGAVPAEAARGLVRT